MLSKFNAQQTGRHFAILGLVAESVTGLVEITLNDSLRKPVVSRQPRA